MKSLFAALCTMMIVLSGANVSRGDILLAGWDFDPLTGGSGNFGPSPLAASETGSGVTAGGLQRFHTLGSGSGAANAWGANNFSTTATNASSAIAAQNFATFTIAPTAGNLVSFTTISPYNIRRSATGPTTGQWQFAVGAGSFQDIGSAITWGTATNFAGNAQSAIDLTGISALQGVTDTVTFRVVKWGATGAGGTWYLNDPSGTVGSDFGVRGNVSAVPEPASMLLLGVAGVGGLAFRRFRGKSVKNETVAS